ncbi:hypothetical protein CW304_32800 [Bacillus sp. UFRGS-B20]|nr:hypothetical protein CW304_32800 [Bacillus sp. UFRGS-B20]
MIVLFGIYVFLIEMHIATFDFFFIHSLHQEIKNISLFFAPSFDTDKIIFVCIILSSPCYVRFFSN